MVCDAKQRLPADVSEAHARGLPARPKSRNYRAGKKLALRRQPTARRHAQYSVSRHTARPGAQGADWNGQVKLGNNEFYGVNYLQSVTPHLALGGEAFWLGQQRKSGAGFAARHADAAHVATCQVATTGLVSLTYLQKVSEKVRSARV